MKLKDKVIIVTGGSGLIGREIITYLREAGSMVISAEISVKNDWEQGTLFCDITSPDSVLKMIDAVMEKYGRIDGLVNSAYPRTKDWGAVFEDVKFESWQKNVDMQLNSVFFICQQVLAIMKEQKSGSIVNFASIYGVVGNDFTIYEGLDMTSPAAYSAIKGGVINFSRYLASYFGKYNIRVNVVSPGGIFDNQKPEFVRNYSEKSPMKRMGYAKEIAPEIIVKNLR